MNTPFFAGMLGGWEIVLILAVVLLLFGAKKLPELAKGLGQGIKEFKKATTDVQRDLQTALEEDVAPPTPPAPKSVPEKSETATAATPSTPQSTAPKA
ncbi:MAG TPA: twin-arginine translocase TatA/TatE family subunit [Verrucomicrobiae bacterium]|jgi:sec-independent protein translocase protein TatA